MRHDGVADGRVYIERAAHSLDSVVMAVPALERDRSDREMIAIVVAEVAERENRPPNRGPQTSSPN